ncbi:MAG: hypothetical protein EA391_05670 [Balneolaceae bacterium]|nr:MAG: hypothetical protein EA391_05670 [Balneolaceae bacterium]
MKLNNIGILTFLTLMFVWSSTSHAQNHEIIHGVIDGAPFKVVTPEGWNGGNLFFHVHGWRPADAPHEADLHIDDPFYQEILNAGWAIGRTAFVENGVDHDAHTKDLYKLKEWVDENLGTVDRLIMEGESTAGTLMLRIAEQNPGLADGVIAKGAFIRFDDETHDSYLEATPAIPAILMSNLSELEGPLAYTTKAQHAEIMPAPRPLLRVGHVNVNWKERRDAFNAMNNWLDTGETEYLTEGTQTLPDRETNTEKSERSITNKVIDINPFYGNAFLNFHPDEFAEFGIHTGDDFLVKAHGNYWKVHYGQSYGDVSLGEWVAFPTASDTIMLVRYHESATETAELTIGDAVSVFRLAN